MQNHNMSHWDRGWRSLKNVAQENINSLQKMLHSSHWMHIQRFLEREYGSIKGLKAIELGCGRGVASAALATQGAEVTLVDLSEAALSSAKEFFSNNGLGNPRCILADVLQLPDDLLTNFDVACSFGLAEHFTGQERIDVFKAHVSTLKSGGSVVVSVPNRLYLPGQIYKFVSERLGTWPYGFERDFTPRELLHYGQMAGIAACKVVGSEVIYDLYSHILLKLPAFLRQITCQRSCGPVTAQYDESGRYTMTAQYKKYVLTSPFDSIFGFTLVLLGRRLG